MAKHKGRKKQDMLFDFVFAVATPHASAGREATPNQTLVARPHSHWSLKLAARLLNNPHLLGAIAA